MKLWQFVVATFCVLPKILLQVFIASTAASLSDGDQREHMDTRTATRTLPSDNWVDISIFQVLKLSTDAPLVEVLQLRYLPAGKRS